MADELAGLGPALHRHLAAPRVDADGDAAGKRLQASRTRSGLRTADGAEDDAADALFEPGLDGGEVADAAAELHRHRHRPEDGFDGRCVDRLAGKRAVQIDDVQVFEALRLEAARLGGRIVVENGGLGHIAELEAHALAVLEVDGRKQDHRARAFALRRPGTACPAISSLSSGAINRAHVACQSSVALRRDTYRVASRSAGRTAAAYRGRCRSTSGSRAGCASAARTCWRATAAIRAGCTRSGRRSASPAAAPRPWPCSTNAIPASPTASISACTGAFRKAIPPELQPGLFDA